MAVLNNAQLNELVEDTGGETTREIPPSDYDTQRGQLSEVVCLVAVSGHLEPSTLDTQRSRLVELALANTERHPFVLCPEH